MTRRCEKMHPQDSWEWAHATHRISTIYIYFFISSMIFVGVSLYFFSKEFVVSPDNFSELVHSYRSDYTNKTTISYDEVIDAMNPFHPFHKFLARNHIRHSFGTVYVNHCYVFPYPNGTNLPSILRRMTFSAPAQASMRTAVLITVLLRMVIVLIRTSDVMLQNPSKHVQIRCIGRVCTVTDLMVSVFGMFVTCLHSSVDMNDSEWLPAICEYICIVTIVVFYLTQLEDFTKMQMVLSCEREETMCCMEYIDFADFKPAMLHDFHKLIEHQRAEEEKRLHKSIIFVS
ncbi:hypothetical protein GCK72_005022 [Caenorhabditis remanei]|uniref:Uncharacterized protein n=1 Tax=Caenorhabditis remanei TaxID=31234 RepID=A0A6A5HDQ5_CAERE|nr:hypothetical protein GCK72_005022 [Caenorhabditis remanei]KAF1765071.1 hypothetical protein GCK72_005022 [Caenorhabditis remanei]